jgi:hypothetical protein
MSTATPFETATWLRAVADQLEKPTPAPLTVYLAFSVCQFETTLSEADRVSAVDAIASALGVTAQPTKVASFWQHKAERSGGPHHLVVSTAIAGPRLCACGAACTHGGPSAA